MKRLTLILMSLIAMYVATPSAEGAPSAADELFVQFPEDPTPGKGADQLFSPEGVAADPATHHLYVTDSEQARVNVFTAWGEFVSAFGWGVSDGSNGLQTCTSSCREGLNGDGPGEFGRIPAKSQYVGPTGVAAGEGGGIFVMDLGNARVQKFDSDGRFQLMFGGGVDEGPHHPGNVCTAQFVAEGDICGAGTSGTGPGEFAIENVSVVTHNYLAVGPEGTVYVADKGRIQAFGEDGSFKYSLPLPGSGNPGALAVDPSSGDLFFTFSRNVEDATVYRLDHVTGAVLDEIVPHESRESFEVDEITGLAVDATGNLYVSDQPKSGPRPMVLKYGPSGELISTFDEVPPDEGANGGELPAEIAGVGVGVVGAGADESDVYVIHRSLNGSAAEKVAHLKVFGPNPDPAVVGPPPKVAPSISKQYATSVGTHEATLGASINPHFWTDTTDYLEYGTGKCSEGGCETQAPFAPGSQLTQKGVSEPVEAQGISLTGLQEGTTYHYRFVARTVFGLGEEAEVRGVGGEVGNDGAEATFTTRTLPPSPNTSCPNQALRPGPVALLPDCRAYEMVSPLDKNGSDISVLPNVTGFPAGLDQAALSGEGLTYSAYRAFGDAPGGGYTSQYLATRDPGTGWSSHSVSAPREGGTFLQSALLDREYRALSPDLSEGWVFRETDPLLDEAAPSGYANLYRRAADGSYEAAVRGEPIGAAAGSFVPELQGEGGGCTVFTAKAKLTANASAAGGSQLYETCEGTTSLVSVLPSGSAAPAASAGTSRGDANRGDALHNAVSADGSTVFWSNAAGGTGKLFARIGGSETLALSKSSARFLTAAADGSKAIFTEGEKLFSFTVGTNKKEAPTLIAEGFLGFLGAGEDASHIYFLSKEELAPGAEAGKPNLYLYEAGEAPTFTYIATLAAADAVTEGLAQATPVSLIPTSHTAQATADGGALVFDSVAPLTGFDNTDQKSGEPDLEVFVYRAATGSLLCASCDPSAQRPEGREIVPSGQPNGRKQPVAATIPVAGSSLYTPRAISEDGTRAFFTSYVPLALRDTNGKADVYEWEAEGHGDCTAAAPGYDPAWGGCVNLISSGDSPSDSVLVDSGADGRDVFFKTYSSLVPQDPGLRDIYDAREGGGFPPPPVPAAACEGEACQGPVSPPDDPTPASSAFQGAGNVREEAKPAKKKHKHKKHHKKHHKKNPEQRANAKQRSGK